MHDTVIIFLWYVGCLYAAPKAEKKQGMQVTEKLCIICIFDSL